MRFFSTPLILSLLLTLPIACNRDDAQRDNPTSAHKKPGSETDAKSILAQVKDGVTIDQPPPKDAEDEVPASEVAGIELVIAERESAGGTAPDVLVYVILYDKDQNMVSADGSLEIVYTLSEGDPKHKKVDLVARRFREQVIPGEEESTLTFLADIMHSPSKKGLLVHATFDSRLETDSSLDEEPEAAPAAE